MGMSRIDRKREPDTKTVRHAAVPAVADPNSLKAQIKS